MPTRNLQDYHVEYMDVTRHWNSRSEKYSGGDSLLTALYNGWDIGDTVYTTEFWYTGRNVPTFHFELEKNGKTETMVVLSNPYVRRIIRNLALNIVELPDPNSEKAPANKK